MVKTDSHTSSATVASLLGYLGPLVKMEEMELGVSMAFSARQLHRPEASATSRLHLPTAMTVWLARLVKVGAAGARVLARKDASAPAAARAGEDPVVGEAQPVVAVAERQ